MVQGHGKGGTAGQGDKFLADIDVIIHALIMMITE